MGNFSWDSLTRTLTTDDFTLGYWAANGIGWQLGQNITDSGFKAVVSGDGIHGECRLEGGNCLVKCTPENGFEVWRSDAGLLQFGVDLTGKLRLGLTLPAAPLGSVASLLEVFDASGASLGFVPIYAGA